MEKIIFTEKTKKDGYISLAITIGMFIVILLRDIYPAPYDATTLHFIRIFCLVGFLITLISTIDTLVFELTVTTKTIRLTRLLYKECINLSDVDKYQVKPSNRKGRSIILIVAKEKKIIFSTRYSNELIDILRNNGAVCA